MDSNGAEGKDSSSGFYKSNAHVESAQVSPFNTTSRSIGPIGSKDEFSTAMSKAESASGTSPSYRSRGASPSPSPSPSPDSSESQVEIRQGSMTSLQSPLIRTLISPTENTFPDARRPALFEDHVAPSYVPGSLHLAPDGTIEKLVGRLGAIPLIRQLAEDLAHRDRELVSFRHKAEERERTLRKMLVEVEVSNADIEKRLAKISSAQTSRENVQQSSEESDSFVESIDDMMQQAMCDEDAFIVTESAPEVKHRSNYGDEEGSSDLVTPKATIRGSKNLVGSDSASIKSNSSKSSTFRGWKGWFGGQRPDGQSRPAGEDKKSAQDGNNTVKRQGLRHDLFMPPPPEDNPLRRPIARTLSRSSLASCASAASATPARRKLPSLSIVHPDANGAPRPPLKSPAIAAEPTISGSPPSGKHLMQKSAPNAAATKMLRAASQASLKDHKNAVSPNPSSPKLTASKFHPPPPVDSRAFYNRRQSGAQAKDDLQRIMAKNVAKVNEGPRKRTLSISSNAGSTKGGSNNGGNWLSSTIKDHAAGIVPLASANQTAAKPDVSLGPVEMETIVPHAIQPPTLLPSWSEHYPTDYLTDRFGFIYDRRQRETTEDSENVIPLEREAGPTSVDGTPTSLSPKSLDSAKLTLQIRSPSPPPLDLNKTSGKSSTESLDDTRLAPTISVKARSTRPSASVNPPSSTLAFSKAPLALRSKSGTTTIGETTVKSLLDQLSDLHDSLQRDRGAKWNEFLKKIRAERRKSDVDEAAMPETMLGDGELIGVATLGSSGKGGKQIWKEFKKLVLGGIPVSYRWKIWAECSGACALRVPGYYEELLGDRVDDPLIVSQISMDINRTLTDNIFFRQGPGVTKLKQVLLAYSRRNPAVGYCQGMNMIAASLLLIMPTEEDAFWVLVSIVENILPKTYFEQSLLASRADQQVLKQYVREVLPQLDAHLQKLGVELEALTFQWFLSIFTDCLAAEALYRVWDVLLCVDGNTFLFQTALALLQLNEKALLDCASAAAVYSYLNSHMTHQGISIDGLIQASEALRPQVKKADVEARRNAAIELELAGTELDAGRDCHTTIVESSLQPKKEIQGDESRGSESSPTAGEVTSTGGSKLMEGTHGVGSTQTFDGCTSEALDTATATTDTSISLTMEVSS